MNPDSDFLSWNTDLTDFLKTWRHCPKFFSPLSKNEAHIGKCAVHWPHRLEGADAHVLQASDDDGGGGGPCTRGKDLDTRTLSDQSSESEIVGSERESECPLDTICRSSLQKSLKRTSLSLSLSLSCVRFLAFIKWRTYLKVDVSMCVCVMLARVLGYVFWVKMCTYMYVAKRYLYILSSSIKEC